jgi:hypothetical protein
MKLSRWLGIFLRKGPWFGSEARKQSSLLGMYVQQFNSPLCAVARSRPKISP